MNINLGNREKAFVNLTLIVKSWLFQVQNHNSTAQWILSEIHLCSLVIITSVTFQPFLSGYKSLASPAIHIQPIQLQSVQYIYLSTQTTMNNVGFFPSIYTALHIKSFKSSYCSCLETQTIETQNCWSLKGHLEGHLVSPSI